MPSKQKKVTGFMADDNITILNVATHSTAINSVHIGTAHGTE